MGLLETMVLDSTRKTDPTDSNLADDDDEPVETPAFLTIQSLTYSGSIAVVGVVWNLAQRIPQIPKDAAASPLIPLVLAGFLMLAGFLFAYNDLKGASKRGAAAIIATFNALLLTAGALGISTAASTVAPIP